MNEKNLVFSLVLKDSFVFIKISLLLQSRGWNAGDWENKVEERGRGEEKAMETEGEGVSKTPASGKRK